ncbi:hypothetical protein [Pseudooceanicola sp. MF1-13]|uniref:hypothetical protein n=1 Tax=Pseudooceanicola sp. MF1-13 TaxID=3379095 RepID=UPI003892971D
MIIRQFAHRGIRSAVNRFGGKGAGRAYGQSQGNMRRVRQMMNMLRRFGRF